MRFKSIQADSIGFKSIRVDSSRFKSIQIKFKLIRVNLSRLKPIQMRFKSIEADSSGLELDWCRCETDSNRRRSCRKSRNWANRRNWRNAEETGVGGRPASTAECPRRHCANTNASIPAIPLVPARLKDRRWIGAGRGSTIPSALHPHRNDTGGCTPPKHPSKLPATPTFGRRGYF